MGRWSQQKGIDLIADVFFSILEEYPSTQLICVGPVIDLYGKFAAVKLEKMMNMYPGRVYSKPEFTALPPCIFSGAEFSLIPSRDEPFGLVAVEVSHHILARGHPLILHLVWTERGLGSWQSRGGLGQHARMVVYNRVTHDQASDQSVQGCHPCRHLHQGRHTCHDASSIAPTAIPRCSVDRRPRDPTVQVHHHSRQGSRKAKKPLFRVRGRHTSPFNRSRIGHLEQRSEHSAQHLPNHRRPHRTQQRPAEPSIQSD